MWLSRPGHSPSPLEPTGQVRLSQTTSHYLQKPFQPPLSRQATRSTWHGSHCDLPCVVAWPLPNRRRNPRNHGDFLTRSGTNANTASRPGITRQAHVVLCEPVQSQQLPTSSPHLFWHQGLRLLLHLCVVCLAWSRTQQSKVGHHHSPSRLRPTANKVSLSFPINKQTTLHRGNLHSAAVRLRGVSESVPARNMPKYPPVPEGPHGGGPDLFSS